MEPAESDEAAVVREVAEETGLATEVVRYVGSVLRAAPGGGTYVIRDFLMRLPADTQATPEPLAGDDADDARWVTRAQLADLPLVEGLLEALTEWSVLPG